MPAREQLRRIQENFDFLRVQAGQAVRLISGVVDAAGNPLNSVPVGSYTSARTGAGQYTLTWVNPFPTATYVVTMSAAFTAAALACKEANGATRTTTTYQIYVFNTVTGALADGAFEFHARG